MTNPSQPAQTRVLDLQNGSAIWKVHLDCCREQDLNARVMPAQKFEQLIDNIKRDRRLESLPLCTMKTAPSGNIEFPIISGHHRLRASRAAGVMEIFILVIEEDLSRDQIRSKQLAHNAIAGFDDPQVLSELYQSIEDITERIASGITDLEMASQAPPIKVEDISVEYDFELLAIAFLPHQKREFEDVLRLIETGSKVAVADLAAFPAFSAAIRQTGKAENVRNLTATLLEMARIVKEHYESQPPSQQPDSN